MQHTTQPRAALLSCDVFDTALIRSIGQPSTLFLFVGKRLAARRVVQCSAEAFARARVEANRRARVNAGRGIGLRDIYHELQFALGLTDAERDAAMAEELALEAQLLQPVPGVAERLSEARAGGMKVAFLSDMYLESSFLRSQLERHGLYQEPDGCYVSCETGCGKEDGRAFRTMARRESVPLGRVVHRGNDPRGDIAGARAAGAAVEPFLAGNLNRYEEILESHTYATEGLSSAMAGAARLARLSVPAALPREVALRDVAASVGGPALVSYVLWVLLRARTLGVRRLYFLARDGYILMRVAESLIQKLGLDLEARYLEGGRQAWYISTIQDVSPEDLFWAIDYGANGESVETVLRRLGLASGEIEEALEETGFPRATWTRHRGAEEHDILWSIARHPTVRDLLLERAAERRREVLAYFRQEGLLDGSDWALVDVGWSGRVLGALDRILKAAGGGVPAAFFFARLVDREKHSLGHEVPVHAYLSDHERRRGHRHRLREIYLELFCGADHGVTVGYRRDGVRMVPILASEHNESLTRWGLPIIHRAILAFVDRLWLDAELLDLGADMRPAVADVLNAFLRTPTTAEARAWGTYPFEYGRNGMAQATIATPLTVRQLPQALRRGWMSTRAGTEWIEGGLAITPRLTRGLLESTLAVRKRLWAARRKLRAVLSRP